MRYPSVFVRDVTDEERQHLKAGLRTADAWRVRRCQIILASEYGAGVPRIARQMGCSEQTVRNTIHAFTTHGVVCLQRASSRPRTTRAAGECPSPATPGLVAPESAHLRPPDQSVDFRVGSRG